MTKQSLLNTHLLTRIRWSLLGAFLAILILLHFQPAQGQEASNVYEVSFAQLGYTDEILQGPYGSIRYTFSLPSSWLPSGGSLVSLNLAYTVSGEAGSAPASVEVYLNSTLLHSEVISSPRTISLNVPIPDQTLRVAEERYINNLEIRFRVSARCKEAQFASLTIRASSRFRFAYQKRPIPLDLAFYPKPLYVSRAFETPPVHFILPNEPTPLEVEAAARIAARLGMLTSYQLPIEASLVSHLPVTATQQHQILIGEPGRMPLLEQLTLPVPFHQRSLGLSSQMPASVQPGHSFTYTLVVQNSSSQAKALVLEDHLSPFVTVEKCDACTTLSDESLRWDIPSLQPGETFSLTVQARLDAQAPPGESIEHTAVLKDDAAQIINVDTLTTSIGLEPTTSWKLSPPKGPYFFALEDRAIPETDGVVQILPSPWNDERAIIVVTGLDDQAVYRAAQALASGNQVLGLQGQFAIVRSLRPGIEPTQNHEREERITLASLGYETLSAEGRQATFKVRFDIPRGGRLTEEAFIALHIAHGVAFNTISSSLEIYLNNLPVGSVALKEDNASDSWVKVSIPARELKAGRNQIELKTAADWPACMDEEDIARLWVTIYDDSYLYLSLEVPEERSAFDLADYPRFLFSRPGLQDVVIVLPQAITSPLLKDLLQLLSYLGSITKGSYLAPRVVFGEPGNAPTDPIWSQYNVIVVGRPTQNPYVAFLNEELPQPFLPGRDEIYQVVGNVVYRLPPDYDLGSVQIISSPYNRQRPVLVVTGTTDQGVEWALQALAKRELISRLAGNMAFLLGAMQMHLAGPNQLASTLVPPPTPTGMPWVAEETATPTPSPTSTKVPTITPAITLPDIPTDIPAPGGEVSSQRPSSKSLVLLGVSLVMMVGATAALLWQRRL